MTDYTRATGSSGTMMIRDTGSYVEFWIKAGSSTFMHEMPWRVTANGATSGWQYFDFSSGGSWQRVWRGNISYDQTVTFYLGDTGTSGLGGPTTFSVFINRSGPPSPPSGPRFSNINATYVDVSFTDGSNNGLPIDSRQIGYGTSSPTTIVSSDGSTRVYNLKKGASYYFWARTHNAKGWSAWGPRNGVTMLREPDAPSSVALSAVTQTKVHAVYTDNYNGGSKPLEWQIGYGTDPTTPQSFASGYNRDITGLLAGEKYYFWARTRNVVGWSPWSKVSSVDLVAGAYVWVDGVKKRAVPYVKVNGEWKVAEAYANIKGYWGKSS